MAYETFMTGGAVEIESWAGGAPEMVARMREAVSPGFTPPACSGGGASGTTAPGIIRPSTLKI